MSRPWSQRFLVLSLSIVIFLSGCSANIKNFFKDEEVRYSSLPPQALMLTGKDILQQTKELIVSAKKAIFIEQSLFNDSSLYDLLLKKSKEGIEIRIILNQSTSNREILEKFKSNNISAHFYPGRKGQINNVKFLIVDYDQAIIYGSAWANEELNSYSLAVMLEGKAAQTATTVFNKDWRFTTTLSLEIPEDNSYPDDYITLATNTNVKQQLLSNINSSTKTIYIEAEEVSDTDIIATLVEAKNKGIDVKIILDAQTQRNRPTPIALSKLEAAGISVRYHNQTIPLRRNFGLFDTNTFVFSSSGWTYNAFVMNHEFSITVPSPDATAVLNQTFLENWNKAVSSSK